MNGSQCCYLARVDQVASNVCPHGVVLLGRWAMVDHWLRPAMPGNSATMLALGNVEAPRDLHNLPANDKDAKSLGDANWKRDAESGDWQRETVIARTDRGHPLTRTELERDAEQVIKANIASGPAPIAARYELAYRTQTHGLGKRVARLRRARQ
ncbi:hypothetical protein [Lysobacter sp. Root667]|uniref:hypothetical protein n=1 Tax=Lysobacter sp. Root667 TaxID=1736581 RepID=UPI0012DECAB5|nr:hypothetical protein [Lysobacter sp. Root667]